MRRGAYQKTSRFLDVFRMQRREVPEFEIEAQEFGNRNSLLTLLHLHVLTCADQEKTPISGRRLRSEISQNVV